MNRLITRFKAHRLAAHSRRKWLSDRPLPDEMLAAGQSLERMRRALDGLSGRTRAIFLLHRLDGLDYSEIAEHVGVTVIAVEKHIASALTVLAEANDQG